MEFSGSLTEGGRVFLTAGQAPAKRGSAVAFNDHPPIRADMLRSLTLLYQDAEVLLALTENGSADGGARPIISAPVIRRQSLKS